jgi:hypothetical protein
MACKGQVSRSSADCREQIFHRGGSRLIEDRPLNRETGNREVALQQVQCGTPVGRDAGRLDKGEEDFQLRLAAPCSSATLMPDGHPRRRRSGSARKSRQDANPDAEGEINKWDEQGAAQEPAVADIMEALHRDSQAGNKRGKQHHNAKAGREREKSWPAHHRGSA